MKRTKKNPEPVDDYVHVTPPAPPTTSLQKLSQKTEVKTQETLLGILDDTYSQYQDIDLTEAETIKLSKTLRRLSTGSSTFSVLYCKGAECPFASRCELVQMVPVENPTRHGKAPVGKDCILETTVLRDALTSYIREYQVDPDNYTEVQIVTELAEIESLLWRINMQLASGPSSLLTIEQPIGFDKQSGNPIFQQQVAPLFEQKQKLANRKSKLVKLMVGDRQEKYKMEAALKQKPVADASSQMSQVKQQLQALQNRLNESKAESDNGKILEAKIVSPEEFMLDDE